MSKHRKAQNVFDQFHDHPVCSIPSTGRRRVDQMDVYRPKRKDMAQVKDYNLTQTYTVMDRDPVKIHLTDTECEYKFHPPGLGLEGKNDRVCVHGPLENLLMEEFVDVIEYYQIIARDVLKQHIKRRVAKENHERRRVKKCFQKLLGPDWFQELSYNQRAAVDGLAKAITTDLNHNTIENTQFAIAKLGLLLRPNHCHVKQALKLCASCPVEFLLVLYQLINPQRTTYSINDRLLLSAVMHLTIRSTLKELHIRIPSPPRIKPKPTPVKKPPQKAKCPSPYLENLVLKDNNPCRSFHSPDKFYVRNEYFNYIDQMRLNHILLRASGEGETHRDFLYEKTYTGGVCTCDNCAFPDCTAIKDVDEFTRIEIDLITEWTKAQKYYTSLGNTDCVPALFKPSVYICPIGKFRPHPSTSIHNLPNTPNDDAKTNSGENSTIIDNSSTETIKKCACKPQDTPQIPQVDANNGSKISSSTDHEEGCICSMDDSYEFRVEEEEFLSEQVTPVPFADVDYGIGRLLAVKTTESQTCACKQAILKRIEQSLCHCERCEDDRRRRNSLVTYIIDDTKENTGINKSVPIIKDCKVKPICTCMEKYAKRWEQFERRRGIRKVQEALKSLDEKFVINGTAIGPDGKIVYILSSVMPKRCCQCSKLKEMEEEEKRTLKQMPMLPGGCIKYHIAGVQERPEGNVYVLAGTTENTECDCMTLYERFTREHSLCMKMYEEYMKKIAYDTEEYLKEVDPQYCAFEASASWTESEVNIVEKSCPCHCDRGTQMCCCYCQCKTQSQDSIDCICSVKSCPCGFGRCECITEEEGLAGDESLYEGEAECNCTRTSQLSIQEELPESTTNCGCSEANKTSKKDTDICDDTNLKSVGKKDATKTSRNSQAVVVENVEDTILDKIKEAYQDHPLYKVEDPPELERYMIFKELPSTEHEQTNVLKKALKKLAEDGFPLARLPDAHTLPIFKAWWRYRCRKYYTARERYFMLNLVDKLLLQRCNCSRLMPRSIDTNFLRKRKDLQNWDHHTLIKTHNLTNKIHYYRRGKHMSINYARDLYTLMRQYDFHNSVFHDVFFSYMPSKEEDIMVDQIWKSSEFRSVQSRC